MKATDTTLWSLNPFMDVSSKSAQKDMFLPNRYCRKCFRDNAEAAQSRRDLQQQCHVTAQSRRAAITARIMDCASSDGGGASEEEPSDVRKDRDGSSSDEDASSDGGGAREGEPCDVRKDREGSSSDEDSSSCADFCEGPGTPCYFWSDRLAEDEVTDQMNWWATAFSPLSGYFKRGNSIMKQLNNPDIKVSDAKRFME